MAHILQEDGGGSGGDFEHAMVNFMGEDFCAVFFDDKTPGAEVGGKRHMTFQYRHFTF